MTNNAAGGKGPWGGHADGAGTREGMAAKSGPNDPGGAEAEPVDGAGTLRKSGTKRGHHVLDADIRDYFGGIDHDERVKLVARRVSDRRMLKLLRQRLEAGVMEDGTVSPTVTGTPQGGVVSPLLSNIYLHVLDVLWTRHSFPLGTLLRHADDFVVMCRAQKECEQAEERMRTMPTRLGLELHPEKTRRVELTPRRRSHEDMRSFWQQEAA